MKVVLIYPAELRKADIEENEFKVLQSYHMPLGILYIGQVLKDNGHKVILYDHNITGAPIKTILTGLKKTNPNALGFTVLSANLPVANAIVKEMKQWNPNLVIIYGGYAATFCGKEILSQCEQVDFCVRGEGELTIVDLLETLENGKPLSAIRGITYREEGKIVENQDRPLIENLDSIPIPDRKLSSQIYAFSGRSTTIISSRGCPYQCRFCSCRVFARGRWRLRSIENLIEEMRYLQNEGFQELLFTDDCFNANMKRTLKLCQLIKKEKIEMAWHSVGRVDRSDVHLLRTMVKAGCRSLVYGLESANQRILDYYNKQTTPEMGIQAIKNSKKAGLDYIGAGFIIGAPIETREEVINTIKFGLNLQKYGLTTVQFQILYLSLRTDLYQEFIEKGLINHERDCFKDLPAVEVASSPLSRSYLDSMAKWGFKEFVTNKQYMIYQFLKSAGNLYRLRVLYSFLHRNKVNF